MPESPLQLDDGARVAVIGGGPAGSFFAYFLLLFAERSGKSLEVDIYDPRDFSQRGPLGCNMCGGIVSESLIQSLAMEGINLPETVVQRGIDSYAMHTEAGTCKIETPTHEKRIAAVHRGAGPRSAQETKWLGFDGHLLKLACDRGARFRRGRVTALRYDKGKPELQVGDQSPQAYDLISGAIGVNSGELKLFEGMGFGYRRPAAIKTFITELSFGVEQVHALFGSSMHVFLLNLPRLDFAAIIPKGDFATLCLLGTDIDKELIGSFFGHRAVKALFPPGWIPPVDACRCFPKMAFGAGRQPFADRVILVGDTSAARLYKDGIGAAFRTAKAAARTAVFDGVSKDDFVRGYLPEYNRIVRDNRYGKVIFALVHLIKHLAITSKAVLHAVAREAEYPSAQRRVSMVLWDIFTGSSSYQSIFFRTLHPWFQAGFSGAMLKAAVRHPSEH